MVCPIAQSLHRSGYPVQAWVACMCTYGVGMTFLRKLPFVLRDFIKRWDRGSLLLSMPEPIVAEINLA